jgi:phenylacetyl-CoA:acceptor oxidoreductase 27-kDa subunit
MSHWVMVIDLKKCTGCQTCMVACKVENALGPILKRVNVIEKETGEYPDVQRVYIPKRCMNCRNPQCVEVCPSGATAQESDGIVTINREKCIGCRYCMMACPYNARMFHGADQSYHEIPSTWEQERYKEHTTGVVDKCDFCSARVREGLADGLKPGTDQDATPFCVIACMSEALYFGDAEDPDSEVAKFIASGAIQLLPELETDPSVYYLPRRNVNEAG